MAQSKLLDKASLLVAPTSKRNFCRFCGKEVVRGAYMDLQNNKKYYNTSIKRLMFMNIKPTQRLNLNICKPCYRAFNTAYMFCQTFNRTQIKLANIEPSETDSGTESSFNRGIKIKSETSEVDVEKIDEEPVCGRRKKSIKRIANLNKSWTSYNWTCSHCDASYTDLGVLRSHSKSKHNLCFGFECPDCDLNLDRYSHFIEHVRSHKANLKFYCDICDERIHNLKDHTHESDGPMCTSCGEIFPDDDSKLHHIKKYKKGLFINNNIEKSGSYVITVPDLQLGDVFPECHVFHSWKDYVWVCSMCDIKFHSAQALRNHGDAVHDKCFTMKCLDCGDIVEPYQMLILHIARHRPSLRHFCPICNKLAHSDELYREHTKIHVTDSVYCTECGQIYPNRLTTGRVSRKDQTQKFWFLEPIGREAMKKLIESNKTIDIRESDKDSDEEEEAATQVYEDVSEEDDKAVPIDHSFTKEASCTSCNESFLDKRLFKEHTTTSVCPICDDTFNCVDFLEKHLFSSHMAKKPFECYKCGRCHLSRERAYLCMESHLADDLKICKICLSMVLDTYLAEHVEAHRYDKHPLDKACGYGYCTQQFTSWTERVNHRYAKHLMITYREKRTSTRYLTQRNILQSLPMPEKLSS